MIDVTWMFMEIEEQTVVCRPRLTGANYITTTTSEMSANYGVIGGGIAGVTCAEMLSELCPEDDIFLITASKLIKAITNYHKVTRTLEQFDVEERHMSTLETRYPNVKVIQKTVAALDTDKHIVRTCDGPELHYTKLCICTGGKPKVIARDNPHVLGIRDTESVQEFQEKLKRARRIVVIGNGGIATELVYEVEGCEVIWAMKDETIASTFIDAGAATFFLPRLNVKKCPRQSLLKRHKYAHEATTDRAHSSTEAPTGSALGPDWATDLPMTGAQQASHNVHVEYKVEVARLLSPETVRGEGLSPSTPPHWSQSHTDDWPVYVELTNKHIYGCDFVVSATGVVPQTDPFIQNNLHTCHERGIKVNEKMQTSSADVFAAGDVCTASWEHAPHWLQMRLWCQARQMGAYAAKCMVAEVRGEDNPMDFCFEMFAHVTKFFNYKVILLGKFNGQGLGDDQELLLRVTPGEEYVKAVLHDGRMQGAILIGETDLEETFENLILNQIDLTNFKEHLLNPDIDVTDFFD